MRLKTKKRIVSTIAFALVVCMNVSPITSLATIVVESGTVDKLGNLKDNLVYLAQNDWRFDSYAADPVTGTSSCSCSFTCDAESAIDTLMGENDITMSTLNNALSNIKSDTNNLIGIKSTTSTISTNTGKIMDSLTEEGVIYKKLEDINSNVEDLEKLVSNTNRLLGSILEEIQETQHKYRVAHIYSLNNSWSEALWRPYTDECPYIEDIATVQGKFANVYSGYWNTSVTDVSYQTATKVNELGQTVLDEDLLRAYEVLGYDIIRVAEGAVTGPVSIVKCEDKLQTYSEFLNDYLFDKYTKDDGTIGYKYYKKDAKGNPAKQVSAQFEVPLQYYYKEIDNEKITWLDAVTVLYKALGKEKITYTSHIVTDTSITPENSPLSQNLSGITQFDGYNYMVFQTRANPIKQVEEVRNAETGEMELKYNIEYTYWDRAKKDGFVTQNTDKDKPITFDKFCLLAEDMMTAFGEPTISQNEIKALLQVYGSQFPIQLGTDIADAWAYLMVRGILVDPTINYTDTLTRSELLKMAAAIKDESYRADFKNIQITLDLSDVMQEDGYYPVEDFSFTQGAFSSSKTYDHAADTTYEYMIPVEDSTRLTSPTIYRLPGTTNNDIINLLNTSNLNLNSYTVAGATYLTEITLESQRYYVISVPKTYTGNIWIGNSDTELSSTDSSDLTKWYCIPVTLLGGGIIGATTREVVNGVTIVTCKGDNWNEFDYRENDEVIAPYTDFKRAGLDARPTGSQVAYGLTAYERVLAYADKLTSPLVVNAAPDSSENQNLEDLVWVKFTLTDDGAVLTRDNDSSTSGDNVAMYRWTGYAKEFTDISKVSDTTRPDELNNLIILKERFFGLEKPPQFEEIGDDYYHYESYNPGNNHNGVHNFIYAKSDQARILSRMVLLDDFDFISLLGTEYNSISEFLLTSLTTNTADDNINRILNQQKRTGWIHYASITGDTPYRFVYPWFQAGSPNMNSPDVQTSGSVQTHTSITNKRFMELNDSLFPFLFLVAAAPLSCYTEGTVVLAQQNESENPNGVYLFNEKLNAGTNSGNDIFRGYLADNLRVFLSENEDDLIMKWRTVYNTRQADYGYYSNGGIFDNSTSTTNTANNSTNITHGFDKNSFYLQTQNPNAILSDLGSLESQYRNGIQGYGSSDQTYNLNANVASSAIMNRSQQVLVSWNDLVKCGFIKGNNGTELPKPNDNGTYSFMTDYGQVIVNDINKTIQIGSVLYDLYYKNEESPTLVYNDVEQNMLYFDYRCVLGVVSEKFQRSGTTTEFLDNCIGAGIYVVYDLGEGNITSKAFKVSDLDAKNLTSVASYKVRMINSINGFDTHETALGNMYGTNLTYTGRRMSAGSFIPTANWVTCIDDDGQNISGAVYVYYPSVAFTEGFVTGDDGAGNLSIQKPELSREVMSRWEDFQSVVDNANMVVPKDSKLSLKEALKSSYGKDVSALSIDNPSDYPLIMTYYAIAKLYEKTGVYYFDSAWYVREFDVTNNAWYQSNTNNNITNEADADGNTIGIMYWVDAVGYVYNVPTKDEFTWEKYFEGDIMLPLIVDKSLATELTNLNLDYYGTTNPKDGGTAKKIPYGCYITNEGFKYVKCNADGIEDIAKSCGAGYEKADLQGLSSSDESNDNGKLPTPMQIGSDVTTYITNGNGAVIPSVFIPAPSGVYVAFGQNTFETWVVSKLSSYIVDANYVYYGNTQLSLQPKSIAGNYTGFKFAGASDWNAFEIVNNAIMYRVHKTNTVSTLIVAPTSLQSASASGIDTVEIDDLATNPIDNWLSKIGANSLLQAIDEKASWLIVITFNVLPIIGIILMTILVGLAFLAENQMVQMFCDKIIDPVRILTFGQRDIHTWNWRKVMIPCIIMYCVFALSLNGNLIMIVQSLAEWYGVVSEWIGQVL